MSAPIIMTGAEDDAVAEADDDYEVVQEDNNIVILPKPEELPANHLFRLIYRVWDPLRVFVAGMWQPVDWEGAVSDRMGTEAGQAELRQWVMTPFGKRLFLHEFCYFDFGVDEDYGDDEEEAEEAHIMPQLMPALAVTRSVGLQLMERVVEAYPEALGMPDGRGYYPYHIICMRQVFLDDGNGGDISNMSWRKTTEDIFNILFKKCPEVLSKRNEMNGRHALHCVLRSDSSLSDAVEMAQLRVAETLMQVCPRAIQLPDSNNTYPIHEACRTFSEHVLLKTLAAAYPQALQQQEGDYGLTPLLVSLQNQRSRQSIRHLLEACPWAAGIEDNRSLMCDTWDVDMAGDALDYICQRYCENAGVNFFGGADVAGGEVIIDERPDGVWPSEYRKGYIATNIAFVELSPEERNGRLRDWSNRDLEILLDILRVMYGKPCFKPLHAFVQGRLCRPWNLVVLQELLSRYDAGEKDSDGNLPLHLFLESCMIEQDRALQVRFAGDTDDYITAVGKCFELLVQAYPPAVRTMNGDGRPPLHLAIQTLHETTFFDSIIGPLVNQMPEALETCDTKTGFFPFVNAGIGGDGNLDLTYSLLRRDPPCLQKQLEASRNEDSILSLPEESCS